MHIAHGQLMKEKEKKKNNHHHSGMVLVAAGQQRTHRPRTLSSTPFAKRVDIRVMTHEGNLRE